MTKNFTRRQLERWLLAHGFTVARRKGGHAIYTGHGVTFPLVLHGTQERPLNEVLTVLRSVERAGFSRQQVLAELR